MSDTSTVLQPGREKKGRRSPIRLGLLGRILIAFLVVSLLPIAISSFRLMTLNRDAMYEQVQTTHIIAARTTAARVQAYLGARRALAKAAASSSVLSSDPRSKAGQEILSSLMSSSLGIIAAVIRNADDEEVIRAQNAEYRTVIESLLEMPESELATIEGQGSTWLRFETALEGNRGMLILVADLEPLDAELEPEELGEEANLVLAGPGSEVVLGSKDALESYPADMLRVALSGRVSGSGKYGNEAKRKVIGAFSPVIGSPWTVLSRQPTHVAEATALQLRQRSWIAVALAVILSFLLLGVAHRSVVLPIRQLIEAQRHLAGPGGTTSGGNEIEALASSFALLKRRIREREGIGRVFLGRYQVMEVVGEGAMGTVFRGWDPTLKRKVALKTIRFDASVEPQRAELASRLLEEAATVAQVQHANIVSVFDVGHSDDYAFLALEFIDGKSLEHYIARSAPLAEPIAIGLGIRIAKGLAAAHEQGIVHNDIKPANVLLGREGSVKLADFGVSQMVTALAVKSGEVYGTPGYIPPEVLRGEGHSQSGDLFALGVVLYRALTAKKPIVGKTVMKLMVNTVTAPIPRLRHYRPSISKELDDLVMRLLERRPENRYPDAQALIEELELLGARLGSQWGEGVLAIAGPGAAGGEMDLEPSQVLTHISEGVHPPRGSW